MKEVLGVSTRSYYICRVLWVFFLVNCKGKFLITYIFHDVSSYKSIKFHSYRFLLTVLD